EYCQHDRADREMAEVDALVDRPTPDGPVVGDVRGHRGGEGRGDDPLGLPSPQPGKRKGDAEDGGIDCKDPEFCRRHDARPGAPGPGAASSDYAALASSPVSSNQGVSCG